MTLEEKIALQISTVVNAVVLLPSVTIIHKIEDVSVIWICGQGLSRLGLKLTDLAKLSNNDYYGQFFNQEDAAIYIPKITDLLRRNNDNESVSYFQQVRINNQNHWTWHISSTKILMRDDLGQPILLITQSIPIEHTHAISAKADKIIEENRFFEENAEMFSKLSSREIEVLKCFIKGETAAECGEKLFISTNTVDTHRKNIRKKLGTTSLSVILRYARAFDLISIFIANKLIGFSLLFESTVF